jgi:hypothetical protein
VSLIRDVASLSEDTQDCSHGIVPLGQRFALITLRPDAFGLDIAFRATKRRIVMTENLNEIKFELNVEELERIIAPGVATSPIITPPGGGLAITTR